MIVSADDVGRSLRGTAELLNRRVEGLKAFDMSEAGFWRSFGAIWLTLPTFVVALGLQRAEGGRLAEGTALLDLSWTTLLVAFGQLAVFLALPLAMIVVSRRLGLSKRYAAFVIVSNWIAAVALVALSVPGSLLLVGWATPGLAVFYGLAFLVVVAQALWFAAKTTLGVSGGIAAGIVVLALALDILIAGSVSALAG